MLMAFKRRFVNLLSLLLMIIPVIALSFVYYPIVMVYLFPYTPPEIPETPYRLEIPSIQAYSPIIENVDPWNKDEYLDKLQLGVAHAEGTSLPGESGTTYLFAHSSDVPWRLTRYNTAFYKLNILKNGDEIKIFKNGEQLTYTVVNKIEVKPTDTQYLLEDQGDVLILQTCTPIGTDWNRLLVFAEPKK